jgi:hypothetical protein
MCCKLGILDPLLLLLLLLLLQGPVTLGYGTITPSSTGTSITMLPFPGHPSSCGILHTLFPTHAAHQQPLRQLTYQLHEWPQAWLEDTDAAEERRPVKIIVKSLPASFIQATAAQHPGVCGPGDVQELLVFAQQQQDLNIHLYLQVGVRFDCQCQCQGVCVRLVFSTAKQQVWV